MDEKVLYIDKLNRSGHYCVLFLNWSAFVEAITMIILNFKSQKNILSVCTYISFYSLALVVIFLPYPKRTKELTRCVQSCLIVYLLKFTF